MSEVCLPLAGIDVDSYAGYQNRDQCGNIPLTDRYGIYLFTVRRLVDPSSLLRECVRARCPRPQHSSDNEHASDR